MPIIKSAKKALRVSARRRLENLNRQKIYKSALGAVRQAVTAGKKASEISEALKKVKSAVDKAAKTGVIHRNKAARLKSRLGKKVAKIKPQAK